MSNLLARFVAAQTAQDHADMQHQVSHGQDKSIAQMHTEAWNNMKNAPGRLAQGLFTGIASAPVEVANMALKPLGLGTNNPIGGMNSLARLVGADTESLPYQAGTMLPVSPESILGAAHGIPAMVGMFAGVGAKTANIGKLHIAEQMKAAGAADRDIHAKTGWFFGSADGKPRFEIPDNTANMPYVGGDKFSRLDMALNHPDVYSAYPDAASIKYMQSAWHGNNANYQPTMDTINTGSTNKSTTLHELQHAIQQREDWARGGSADAIARNPMSYMSPESSDYVKTLPAYQGASPAKQAELESTYAKMMLGSPEDTYKRLAGESEARLTQTRMTMTPEERAASYPPSMYDVPVDQQIVRFGDNGPAMSISDFKNLTSKQSLELSKSRVSGDPLPEHPDLNIMPNNTVGMVKGNLDLLIHSLNNGSYQITNHPQWGSKQKEFYANGDNIDELISGAKARLGRSDKAISASAIAAKNKTVGGMLENQFGDNFNYANSARSDSTYITHQPTGMKIRIAGHDLPNAYDAPDFEVSNGLSNKEQADAISKFLKEKIAQREIDDAAIEAKYGNAAASISPDKSETPINGMQERTVRADKSGSSELAQKGEAGGEVNGAPIVQNMQDGKANKLAQLASQDSPAYASDMEAQIHLLAAKAQEHGFTSIDDFAAKNPEAFGSAAADWRSGHSQ